MKPLLLTVSLALAVLSAGEPSSLEAAERPVPLTPQQAIARGADSEVSVRFKVGRVHTYSGTLLAGSLPSFGITAEQPELSPNFSVLVMGSLVKTLDRVGMDPYAPARFFEGKTLEVSGRLRIYPAEKPGAKPTYELRVDDLEHFRVLH